MKYSKPIDIPGWRKISERYADWVKFGYEGKHSIQLPYQEANVISPIICPALKRITGLEHKIVAALIFFVKPGTSRGVHIDPSNSYWSAKSNWALNIPIVNTENSVMEWYSGDYSQETYHRPGGNVSERLVWHSEPVLLESCTIVQPTLVYVDIPHDVRNNGTLPRVLLSVRVTPNIMTLDPTI